MKILVVEDDEILCSSFIVYLCAFGHDAVGAKDAEQAVNAVKYAIDTDNNFDCILTDYNLPYHNGVELANKIKKLHRQIPIILFSCDNEIINKKYKNIDYCVKKNSLEEINNVLERISQSYLMAI